MGGGGGGELNFALHWEGGLPEKILVFSKNFSAKDIFSAEFWQKLMLKYYKFLCLQLPKSCGNENEKDDPKKVDPGAQKTKADKSNFYVRYRALLNPVILIILILVKFWTCSFLNKTSQPFKFIHFASTSTYQTLSYTLERKNTPQVRTNCKSARKQRVETLFPLLYEKADISLFDWAFELQTVFF